ncbi:alcohol dehydrogenase [Bacillus sp. FJAT-27225]|uniref:nucleotidyltransferase family protein n=1 Tax=Bacillus sp. FJAT-27225 TaxID=1743144 RepID=UPI00080C3100|nr:nucleotidyltransferase family protein [Bacillus sp. FJAT-27225]OCA87867.1 alcohol dehydrogenase [Bacillus sp. FJAT-27225]
MIALKTKKKTDSLISKNAAIKEAIKVIDYTAQQIAIVVDASERFLGTVSDGDIRRAILEGISLDKPVETIMNTSPALVNYENGLFSAPFNEAGQVEKNIKDNWVVLMAGGLGTRLRPLTDNCPKPLLKVGDKPILETTIEKLKKHGFRQFFLSVNYKAEMIEEYFGDGSKWDVEIDYLHETKRLGTAGALSLLPSVPSKPILVMNGDLLTTVNYNFLLDYHMKQQSEATMCVREYNYQVPYGVVKLDKNKLQGIEEKPVHRSFVSAGIYVLDPITIREIPEDEFYDMPTLFEDMIKGGRNSSVFPLREYWCDIGRIEDYKKANTDFEKVFG